MKKLNFYFETKKKIPIGRQYSTNSISKECIISEHFNGLNISFDQPLNLNVACSFKHCGCRSNSFIWISDKLKAIYFEVPKAGSSSIKSKLDFPATTLRSLFRAAERHQKRYNAHILYEVQYFTRLEYFFKKYYALHLYKNRDTLVHSRYGFYPYLSHPNLLLEDKSDYFKFTVIREPTARFLSNWKMFNQIPERRKILELQLNKRMGNLLPEEFINIIQQCKNHHWQQQINFLPQDIGHLDFIGILEHINRDWGTICKRLNITNTPLQQINETKRKKQISVSLKLQNILNELYSDDYTLYQSITTHG